MIMTKNNICKDILQMDEKDPNIKKLQNKCRSKNNSSKLKIELKEFRQATDETVDAVMKGVITGLALAVAFFIYTPIQEAVLVWLLGYPVWISTIIGVGIMIGIMILISYIYIQIKQFRAKEDFES